MMQEHLNLQIFCPPVVQGELETVVGGVRSHCEELKSGVELQKQYEQLVHSFEELLSLGSDSFPQQPDTELRSRAQLQKKLSSHMVSVVEKKSPIEIRQ